MKKVFLSAILMHILFSFSFAQHQVGHYNITFIDPDRGNRQIETEIYYPATVAGDNTPVASGTFPVIVFGHGFVMAWSAYENLWEEFVPRGYIMVFPRTEGNAFSTNHQAFGWDLQFLVTQLQLEGQNASSDIYNAVANNTALMGHSMGGGAAFLAADSLCVNGNMNLKTLVGLAPAESTTNGVSSINSALSVTVPSVVLSGAQDGVTPPADHHIPMYDNLGSDCKTFVSITGGAHCYFANSNFNCDFGEGTSSSGISISRTEQHQVTFDFLNNWFDYTLKGDCSAFQMFQDSVANSTRVITNQSCTTNPTATINASGNVLTSSETGTNYQWYLNGNAISGANNVNYTATQNGDYTVEVSFANGCPTVSAPYTYSDGTSNISENTNFEMVVYPNPTNGILNIKGTVNDEIQILDLSGRVISTHLKTNTIDVSNLSKGVYYIKMGNTFTSFVKN